MTPTPAEISADLAPLSPEECAARGLRHSSTDDHSSAILTGDTFELRQRMLAMTSRKAGL